MGAELIHETDYHGQPKTVGQNRVLFVPLHWLYYIGVYNVQILAHRHMLLDSEILNPGGHWLYIVNVIPSLSPNVEYGPSAINSNFVVPSECSV